MDFGASGAHATEGRTHVDRPSWCFRSTRHTPQRQPRRLEVSHHLVTTESAECLPSQGSGPAHKPEHTDDPQAVATFTKSEPSDVCREHGLPSPSSRATKPPSRSRWLRPDVRLPLRPGSARKGKTRGDSGISTSYPGSYVALVLRERAMSAGCDVLSANSEKGTDPVPQRLI